jgi:hypothetical protein
MATILKCEDRNFQADPNKIENFKLYSDVSRKNIGLNPKNLNFDLRILNPRQYSAPYHSHRFAEELFMIISGSLTLRTPNGPDTGKILIAPSFEIFNKEAQTKYFEGETDVRKKWDDLKSETNH